MTLTSSTSLLEMNSALSEILVVGSIGEPHESHQCEKKVCTTRLYLLFLIYQHFIFGSYIYYYRTLRYISVYISLEKTSIPKQPPLLITFSFIPRTHCHRLGKPFGTPTQKDGPSPQGLGG